MEELLPEEQVGAPICSTPQNHSLIVARTRTGKGTRVVIPTLLRYQSSAFVIDPKGENAAVTARARMSPGRPGGGQTVHIINPWGELDTTFAQLGFKYATYNPLDILDPKDKETNLVSNAQALAKAICPSDKEGKEAFWNQNAAAILTAVLLWLTVTKGETKTLARAREILTKSKKQFEDNFLVHMAGSVECGGAIQENAARFVGMAAETYSGIMANVAQNTDFLSDPQIKAATNTSSFSMLELVQRPTTIYLVIPPDRIEMQRTWLRLLITAGLQIYKRNSVPRKQAHRCLFLIDELPALGRIDELPKGIADMAGYGVDFALIVQDVQQLEDAYSKSSGTIINNCHYKWFCNIGELKTAKFVSDTLGKKTVATHGSTIGTSFGQGHGSTSQSTTTGQTGRPLLMPDEVLTLGRETAILLAPTGKPHYLIPVDYWKLPDAFAAHKKKYPRWLWKPPLEWDENPLPH
jgi:type IV secretory pathway TraG/TraD family ATPase VirD4